VKVNFHEFNLFTYVFLVYIITLEVTLLRIERLDDNEIGTNELERMWKEAIVA
jgi:hypothetical protein